MKKEFSLTASGITDLENELEELKSKRVDVAERLRVSREHGDLKENAEYHNARSEQVQLELRIGEIEHILRNTQVIVSPKNITEVELGNTVVLKGSKGEQNYTIVGSVEADPAQNKISNESPIGQALMGRAVGDEVVIKLPAGETTYKIKSIQ